MKRLLLGYALLCAYCAGGALWMGSKFPLPLGLWLLMLGGGAVELLAWGYCYKAIKGKVPPRRPR